MADECDLCGGTQEIEMFERGPVPCPSCIGREYDGMIEAKDARIKELEATLKVTPGMVSRAARVLCEVTCAAYPCRECSPGSGAFDLASLALTAAFSPSPAKEQTK